MTSFKKTSFMLMIALGLLGAACGDDDKKSTGKEDAGGDNGGENTDAGGDSNMCISAYEGFTSDELTANIKDAGACTGAADIEGVCKLAPSDKAATVGRACFLAFAGDKTLTDEEKAMMTGDCALNGKGNQVGLKDMLKTMSTGCLNCYIGAVVCAATKCISTCVGGGVPCDECREKEGCTGGFFTCSGLPTGEEIEAAK